MKKYLFFSIFLVLLAVLTMVSCGSKGSKSSEGLSDDEKAELIKNLNYRKACELKDFETAYQIVDELMTKAEGAHSRHLNLPSYEPDRQRWEDAEQKAKEAKRYVVLQEAMLVLESDGTNGLMRIVGIAKEHNAEDWLYSELLDVAKKIGDTDLENRIETMIQPDK